MTPTERERRRGRKSAADLRRMHKQLARVRAATTTTTSTTSKGTTR